jgi:hypothetical protein
VDATRTSLRRGGALVIVSFAHFTLDQVTQGLETD